MAEVYFPFQAGAGTSVTEAYWSMMARLFVGNGVIKGALNELQVYADSSGMQVKVKSGRHAIMGLMYQSDAEQIIPIAAADPANPRIDVIAVRLDWVANTIAIVVLEGVAAANPVAPTLTQTDILITPATARWEIALANVNVPAAAATIAAGNVTDARTFTGAPTSTPTSGTTARYDANGILTANAFMSLGLTGATAASRYAGATASGAPTSGTFAVGDYVVDQTGVIWICTIAGSPGTWKPAGSGDVDTWHTPALLAGWVNFGGGYANAAYRKDADGYVHIVGMIKGGTMTGGTTIFTLPAGYLPLNNHMFGCANYGTAVQDASIVVQSNGNVVIDSVTGANWLTFDAIEFLAEQ